MYYCPSYYNSYNGSVTDDYKGYGQPSQANYSRSGGYTANCWVLAYEGGVNGYPANGIKVARVKSPSNIITVYEASSWAMGDNDLANNGYYGAWLPGAYLGNGNQDRSSVLSGDQLQDYNNGRHNEGINIAYADGHAGFEKSATVYSWVNTTSKNPFRPTTW